MRAYLDNVGMEQMAVVDELALDVLGNLAPALHELDGDLFTGRLVDSKLNLAIASTVDVFQNLVLRLSAKGVLAHCIVLEFGTAAVCRHQQTLRVRQSFSMF